MNVRFEWFPGFALSQAQKSITALHAVAQAVGYSPVLEISSKSPNRLGVELSAFNLELTFDGRTMSVECAFQGSKVFERGAHRGTYESFMSSNAGGGPDGLNYEAFNKVDAETAAYPTTPYLTKEAMLEPMWRIVYDNIFPGIVPVDEGLAQIRTETVALLDRGREDYNARRA